MPIYEYACSACKTVFEEWQSSFQEQEQKCPQCGLLCKRLISQSAFHLKGSGWYVTDYANSGAKENPSVAAVQGETSSSSGEASAVQSGAGSLSADASAVQSGAGRSSADASPKTDVVSAENVSKK